MSKTAVRLLPALAALLLLTAPAVAHERWVRHELKSQFDRSLFESPGVLNLSTLGGALLVAWLLTLVARRYGVTGADRVAKRMASLAPLALGVFTGVGLLGFALEGRFLAPDLVPVDSLVGSLLVWGGGLVGVLLVLGLFARAAGWALLGLYVLALALRPFELYLGEPVLFEHVFNYLEIAGSAIYLGIAGRGALALDALRPSARPKVSPERRAFATGQLRILLGATLIILGLTKFVRPELLMGVIQNYADEIYEPINALTGISPEGYVLAASAVETTLGLLLVLGVFTRVLVAVALALFTTTAFIFQGEVLGHLPLGGIVLALLIDGGGSLRPTRASTRGVVQAPPRPAAGAARTTQALLLLAVLTLSLGGNGCEEASATDPPPEPPVASSGNSHAALEGLGERGLYRFYLETNPAPVELGKFFVVWTRVEDAATGEPVTGGELVFDASMPDHGHGMMTLPRTSPFKNGRYHTAGAKLHMFGRWVYELEFQSGSSHDRVSIEALFEPAPPR